MHFSRRPDVAGYWELLTSGRDAKSPAPPDRWRADLAHRPGPPQPYRSPVTRGGYITDFRYDWRAHKIPPKQIEQADPLQFMLMDATDQALRDAGYDRKPLDRGRAGVVVGTEFGGDFAFQLQMALRLPDMGRILRSLLTRSGVARSGCEQIAGKFSEVLLRHWPALIDESGSFSTSALASRISKTWDLMGGAAAIDCGDNSALAALTLASDLLWAGDCDLLVCAAGQRRMGLPAYEAMSLAGCLAPGEDPAAPFDAAACGYLPGEGVGVLILKRLSDALRDGDPIRAIVHSIGAARAQQGSEALRMAIERSLAGGTFNAPTQEIGTCRGSLRAEEIATLQCDGAAFPREDSEAIRAIAAAYGGQGRRQPLLVSSVVGQIGHTAGASGMASFLKAALEIEHGESTGTANLRNPLPLLREGGVVATATPGAPLGATPEGRRLTGVASCARGLAYHAILERGARWPARQRATLSPSRRLVPIQRKETMNEPRLGPRRGLQAWSNQIPAALLPHHSQPRWPPPRPSARIPGMQQSNPRATGESAASAPLRRASWPLAWRRPRRPPCGPKPQWLASIPRTAPAWRLSPPTPTPSGKNSPLPQSNFSRPPPLPSSSSKASSTGNAVAVRPQIAFLFPGQGSQYPGMLRQLVEDLPAAATAMRRLRCDPASRRLSDICPDRLERNRTVGRRCFSDSGVHAVGRCDCAGRPGGPRHPPDVMAGHSYGEYVALMAAGAWEFEEALRATPPPLRCDRSQSDGRRWAAGPSGRAAAGPESYGKGPAAGLPGQSQCAGPNCGGRIARGTGGNGRAGPARSVSRAAPTRPLSVPHAVDGRGGPATRTGPRRYCNPQPARALDQRGDQPPRSGAGGDSCQPGGPHDATGRLCRPHPKPRCQRGHCTGGGRPATIADQPTPANSPAQSALMIASDQPKRPGMEPLLCVEASLDCAGALETAAMQVAWRPAPLLEVPAVGTSVETFPAFDATARRREKMRRGSGAIGIPPRAPCYLRSR